MASQQTKPFRFEDIVSQLSSLSQQQLRLLRDFCDLALKDQKEETVRANPVVSLPPPTQQYQRQQQRPPYQQRHTHQQRPPYQERYQEDVKPKERMDDASFEAMIRDFIAKNERPVRITPARWRSISTELQAAIKAYNATFKDEQLTDLSPEDDASAPPS